MSSNSKIQLLKEALYKKITSTEDVSALRQCLEKCERAALLSWVDENGYDMLHHTILANNVEAEGMLFALGLFKAPHEPKLHSYLHVAANLGNRSITAMLLQERPGDFSTKKTKFKWLKPPTEVPFVSVNGTSSVTSLDIAAECGHVGCVKTILDFSSVKTRFGLDANNYLSGACSCNSPSALRLLLKQNPATDEVKDAVGTALKLANAECLDVLLSCRPNLSTLFSGMNLYHVLYSYSMSFKKEWYESLLTVTSVLLKHRQNPLSTIPFRTYPLYSLISHIPASNFGQSSTYMTACMVVLLNARVDPNFNEVEYETRYEAFNIQTAFGRSAFPSSLHCLYGNVLNLIRHFDEDTTSVRRFVTKATETLLRHGAEPNVIGPIEDTRLHGNALHAFMKICISLGLDERSITTFRLLIQNGSDPNVETTGIFPLNTFVEEILVNCDKFEKLSKHDEVSITEYVSEVLTTLLDSMLQRSISSSLKYKIDGKPSNAIQRKLYKMCRDEMSKRSLRVDSLTKLCRLQILSSCKWRSTLVVQLPIPVALKKYLNNIT